MSVMNAIRNERVFAVGFDGTHSANAGDVPPAAPQPPVNHPTGDTASPLETIGALQTMEATFDAAMSCGDPAVLMAALASQVRRSSNNAMLTEASSNQLSEKTNLAAQMAAYHKAEEAQSSAATWGLLAKVGAYVAAAVSVAVGVCGAVFSGGTSLVGGIALCILCVSAAAGVSLMVAQDLHAWGNQPPPKWMSIGVAILALVGTVCSLGSGAGGAVAAIGTCLSATAQTVSIVTDIGVETHAFPEPPSWFRMTLAGATIAGAACSAGGSIAGGMGSGAAAATSAVRSASDAAVSTIHAVGQSVRALSMLTQAVGQTGSAIETFVADGATADGQAHRRVGERLHDAGEDIFDALRQVSTSFRRSMQRASDVARDEDNRRSAITRNLARA